MTQPDRAQGVVIDNDMLTREGMSKAMQRDPHVQAIGIRLIDSGIGWLKLGLKVRQDHLSFHGSCHGGVLFSLADTAFGIAANSGGLLAYGIDTHMVFCSTVRLDDEVVAEATELSRSRKLATYRVEIYRAPRELVCTFTGTVYLTNRPVSLADG